jgi:hypothetical protein
MTSLEDLWPGVITAPPDDPGPLLVMADFCDANDLPQLAYGLKWCAGHRKRPYLRHDVRRYPFSWLRRQYRYQRLNPSGIRHRTPSILPVPVFEAIPNRAPDSYCEEYANGKSPYIELAIALATLREIVEVPLIVLPPVPQIVRSEMILCEKCGVFRSSAFPLCTVCKTDR